MAILKNSRITTAFVRGGFHTLRLIRARESSRVGIDDLRRVRRFLFLEFGTALGTNVHATPVFEALKRAVPDAVTMVACSRMGFEVFRHNPFIDYLVEIPRPAVSLLRAARTLRSHLKSTGFVPEIVITSKGNEPRSASIVAFLAGTAIRFGHTLAPELYNVVLRYDPKRSLIGNHLNLIDRLGYQTEPIEPRVFYTREDLDKAERLLHVNGIANSAVRIVCVTQTSRTQRRGWPVPQFISVLNHARSKYNADIIFAGTSSEAQEIETLRAQIPGATISLAGQTTIQTMAALLATSDLLVTLDTGNMHVGRSVGVPMIILGPAWAPSIEWLPLGFDQFQVFLGDLDPCSPRGCEIIQMDAAKVIEALDRLLATYPPSDAARRRRAERNLSSIRGEPVTRVS